MDYQIFLHRNGKREIAKVMASTAQEALDLFVYSVKANVRTCYLSLIERDIDELLSADGLSLRNREMLDSARKQIILRYTKRQNIDSLNRMGFYPGAHISAGVDDDFAEVNFQSFEEILS